MKGAFFLSAANGFANGMLVRLPHPVPIAQLVLVLVIRLVLAVLVLVPLVRLIRDLGRREIHR